MKKKIIIVTSFSFIFFTIIFFIININSKKIDYEKAYIIKDGNIYVTRDFGKNMTKFSHNEQYDNTIDKLFINNKLINSNLKQLFWISDEIVYTFEIADVLPNKVVYNIYCINILEGSFEKINVNGLGYLLLDHDATIEYQDKTFYFKYLIDNNKIELISNDFCNNITVINNSDIYDSNLKIVVTTDITRIEIDDFLDFKYIDDKISYESVIQNFDIWWKYIEFEPLDFLYKGYTFFGIEIYQKQNIKLLEEIYIQEDGVVNRTYTNKNLYYDIYKNCVQFNHAFFESNVNRYIVIYKFQNDLGQYIYVPIKIYIESFLY